MRRSKFSVPSHKDGRETIAGQLIVAQTQRSLYVVHFGNRCAEGAKSKKDGFRRCNLRFRPHVQVRSLDAVEFREFFQLGIQQVKSVAQRNEGKRVQSPLSLISV